MRRHAYLRLVDRDSISCSQWYLCSHDLRREIVATQGVDHAIGMNDYRLMTAFEFDLGPPLAVAIPLCDELLDLALTDIRVIAV